MYWVTKGYVVLDDASFPIIGEGKTEPNDNFISQLVDNAEAAINAVDALGYINRKKVAVGGHSYSAFMTANLLTHSNLFACGIARSGAYNRTLTPFGFQSEQRNYWETPEVYNTMSPFMHADKMKAPLLLVHGEADNNPGTFTLQTERYFQADLFTLSPREQAIHALHAATAIYTREPVVDLTSSTRLIGPAASAASSIRPAGTGYFLGVLSSACCGKNPTSMATPLWTCCKVLTRLVALLLM